MRQEFFRVSSPCKRPGRRFSGLGLFFLLGSVVQSLSADARVHRTEVEPSPRPLASVVPAPSPGANAVTRDQARTLFQAFVRAQRSEMQALEHRQRIELKELKASQAARKKDWETKEKEARHLFFKEHTKGPERRAYVKEFLERRRTLLALMADERSQRVHEYDVRRKAIQDDQRQKLKEFREVLGHGERPPETLWPQADH